MPVRRKYTLRKHTTRRRGRGFFQTMGNALSKAHDWIQSNKIISTVSGALSKVGVPYAGAINTASSALGYGRRRRVGRPRVTRRKTGGSLRSILSSVHRFVKDKKLVSGALSHFGHSKLSSAASSLGYGKRRRRTVRHRGGSMRVFPNAQMAMIKF